MDTPVTVIPAPAPERERSEMRRFLAERGVIMMKENRTVATIQPAYGAALEISGQVLVNVKKTERRISAGVRFEQSETNTSIASAAFVDYDELEEVLGALTFITSSATTMAHDRRDYTEVMYSTRDDVTIGFYQDDQKQQAFVRLGLGSPLMFFHIGSLQTIRAAIVKAGEHANIRRQAWESR